VPFSRNLAEAVWGPLGEQLRGSGYEYANPPTGSNFDEASKIVLRKGYPSIPCAKQSTNTNDENQKAVLNSSKSLGYEFGCFPWWSSISAIKYGTLGLEKCCAKNQKLVRTARKKNSRVASVRNPRRHRCPREAPWKRSGKPWP
jgi:hypothetical protein